MRAYQRAKVVVAVAGIEEEESAACEAEEVRESLAQRIERLYRELAGVGLGVRRDCVRRKVSTISRSNGRCIGDYRQDDDKRQNRAASCCGSTF